MNRSTIIVAAILATLAVWAVGLGCWPFVQWSPLNCRHECVDINSGRVRHQRYLLWTCIYETVEETSLSRLVAGNTADKPPDWRAVNTFSPLVSHSPHYHYHAAIVQISMLDMMWNSVPFTPAAKRQMAQDVLSLWQAGEGYFPVGEYLSKFEPLYRRELANGEAIDAKDLPTTESIIEMRSKQRVSAGP